MSRTEKSIRLVAKLYDYRKTATFLWPDPAEYERRTKPYREILLGWQTANPGKNIIAGYNEIAVKAEAKFPESFEGIILALTAALVDILDPRDEVTIQRRSDEVMDLLGLKRVGGAP